MLVANAVKAIGSAPVVLMLPPEPEKREGMKVPDDHLRPVEQAKASLPPAIAQFPILSARDWEFAGKSPQLAERFCRKTQVAGGQESRVVGITIEVLEQKHNEHLAGG